MARTLIQSILCVTGNRKTVQVSWTISETTLDLLTKVSAAYPGASVSFLADSAIRSAIEASVEEGDINLTDVDDLTWRSVQKARGKRGSTIRPAKAKVAKARLGVRRG